MKRNLKNTRKVEKCFKTFSSVNRSCVGNFNVLFGQSFISLDTHANSEHKISKLWERMDEWVLCFVSFTIIMCVCMCVCVYVCTVSGYLIWCDCKRAWFPSPQKTYEGVIWAKTPLRSAWVFFKSARDWKDKNKKWVSKREKREWVKWERESPLHLQLQRPISSFFGERGRGGGCLRKNMKKLRKNDLIFLSFQSRALLKKTQADLKGVFAQITPS